jgi:hypothetical protein
MGFELNKALGPGYATAFFYWTEGLNSYLAMAHLRDKLAWLENPSSQFVFRGHSETYLSDYHEKWGGHVYFGTHVARSLADFWANANGLRFWRAFNRGLIGPAAPFDICDYLNKYGSWIE